MISCKEKHYRKESLSKTIKTKTGIELDLYSSIGHSSSVLSGYMFLEQSLSSGVFSPQEQQAIFLAVSLVNGCHCCESAHAVLGIVNGLSEEEIYQIRTFSITNSRLRALVTLTAEITLEHGKPSEESVRDFYEAGFDRKSLVELIAHIAFKSIGNYVHNIGELPEDFSSK